MTAPAPSTTPPRRDPGQAERLLRRLDWQVIRRLDGLLQGDHRALFYGSGTDFADLREYQTQDDVRYIDWNVTARLDVAVRAPVHRRPRAHRVAAARPVVVDALRARRPDEGDGDGRAGGDPRPAPHPRRQPHRCGALRQRDRARRRAARRSPSRCCASPATCCEPPPDAGAATDLERALPRRVSTTIRRRSLVFVLSDFISEPGWERALGMLAQRHEVVAVRIWDRPRGRAGRRRRRGDAGRRDRRAAARRHRRPARSAAASRTRPPRATSELPHVDPARRVSTSTTSRPTTTSCACCCAWSTRASSGGRR